MTAGNQFTPLTLELIEEGEFLEAINEAIMRAQHELAAHVEKWGERAGKAKAEVQVTLKMSCDNPGDGLYSIEPHLRVKLPARPPRITAAFSAPGEEAGTVGLFVRGTGSTSGNPHQMHLPVKQDKTSAAPEEN